MTVDDTVIISFFSASFATLTAVITVLWRKLAADHASVVSRVEALEEENRELREALTSGETASAKLASCPAARCPWREDPAKRETTRIFPRPSAA